jgi:hypothetical protein
MLGKEERFGLNLGEMEYPAEKYHCHRLSTPEEWGQETGPGYKWFVDNKVKKEKKKQEKERKQKANEEFFAKVRKVAS